MVKVEGPQKACTPQYKPSMLYPVDNFNLKISKSKFHSTKFIKIGDLVDLLETSHVTPTRLEIFTLATT